MAKVGKISVIKKDYTTAFPNIDTSLRRHGKSRIPGTGLTLLPFKERNGYYRTGLDPQALYIENFSSTEEKEVERARAEKEFNELSAATRFNLAPNSDFYNYSSKLPDEQKISPVKLMDEDNIFNLEDPMQRIAWNWLRVHPRIASSFQAWQRGLYPADTQFYICDDDVEMEIEYKKKSAINKAIERNNNLSPDKRKQIARLMGLPVTDSTKEEVVYNLLDNLIKEQEIKEGQHKGESSINLFHKLYEMDVKLLTTKDLVEQALRQSIYRQRTGGRIFEGEVEVSSSKDELVKFLMDEDHQMDLLALQDKLKTKKILK